MGRHDRRGGVALGLRRFRRLVPYSLLVALMAGTAVYIALAGAPRVGLGGGFVAPGLFPWGAPKASVRRGAPIRPRGRIGGVQHDRIGKGSVDGPRSARRPPRSAAVVRHARRRAGRRRGVRQSRGHGIAGGLGADRPSARSSRTGAVGALQHPGGRAGVRASICPYRGGDPVKRLGGTPRGAAGADPGARGARRRARVTGCGRISWSCLRSFRASLGSWSEARSRPPHSFWPIPCCGECCWRWCLERVVRPRLGAAADPAPS